MTNFEAEARAIVSEFMPFWANESGYKMAIAKLGALHKKTLKDELEELRLDFRGEDRDQYRPKDMISLGHAEGIIDDRISRCHIRSTPKRGE